MKFRIAIFLILISTFTFLSYSATVKKVHHQHQQKLLPHNTHKDLYHIKAVRKSSHSLNPTFIELGEESSPENDLKKKNGQEPGIYIFFNLIKDFKLFQLQQLLLQLQQQQLPLQQQHQQQILQPLIQLQLPIQQKLLIPQKLQQPQIPHLHQQLHQKEEQQLHQLILLLHQLLKLEQQLLNQHL